MNTLIKDIKEVASKLKKKKLGNLDKITEQIDKVVGALKFGSQDEAVIFSAMFDIQCGFQDSDDNIEIKSLIDYFNCTALEVMQYAPAVNSLVDKGLLGLKDDTVTKFSKKSFSVTPEVFSAVIEGREIDFEKIKNVSPYDQFKFCAQVGGLIEERDDEEITTKTLFNMVEDLEKEHSDLEFISKVKADIEKVADRVFFYSICNDFSDEMDLDDNSEISSTLDSMFDKPLERLSYKASISNEHPLMAKKLVLQNGKDAIKLLPNGIRLLLQDKADSVIAVYSVKNRYDFANKLDDFYDYARKDILFTFVEWFEILEEMNPHLTFIDKVKRVLPYSLDRILFYLVCKDKIDDDDFSISRISYLHSGRMLTTIKKDLKDGISPIIKYGLVEVVGGGLVDDAELALTDKGVELFFEEDAELYINQMSEKDLISPDKIKEKRLFFEQDLQRQLSLLEKSITGENYEAMQKRLSEKGMPTGVAALLYGHPGTGKTESVLQMARATGRAVVHIDISATKSCWFGDSEKLIKEVFTNYKRLCKKSNVKPILLFNEADAVFSKRKDTNSSSVAQTENAIQNIILEELENLDGILIATTNMADNLDKAFERRFLFKIRFDKPNVEAKQKIWADKMPSLSAEDSSLLASKYDFSGGEIDNIVRKAIISEVVDGESPSIDSLIRLCDEEKITTKKIKVGFGV